MLRLPAAGSSPAASVSSPAAAPPGRLDLRPGAPSAQPSQPRSRAPTSGSFCADTTITTRSARSRCGSVPPREAQSLPRHHCGVLPVSRSFCPAISGNARFVGYSTNNVTVTAYLGTVRKTDG